MSAHVHLADMDEVVVALVGLENLPLEHLVESRLSSDDFLVILDGPEVPDAFHLDE